MNSAFACRLLRSPRARAVGLASVAALAALFFAGCGSIPDAQVTYYKATSQVSVKVTRSLICDAKNSPLIVDTVTPTVVHSSDTSKPQQFKLAALRGTFADSDIKFELYEDGRLKSVNAAVSGQGEAVLKAVTTLVGVLVAFQGAAALPAFPKECKFIRDHAGDKPISLTYEGNVDPAKEGPQLIPAVAASKDYASTLQGAFPGPCLRVTGKDVPTAPVQYKAAEGDVLLAVRQPAWLSFSVGKPIPGNSCTDELWKGRVHIAQLGTDYLLPVPKAPLFGKQGFGAGFGESGALSSVQYVSGSGAAGALGAATSLATIANGETTAAKLAEVKAEADLIAQQQRLLQCLADPKSCK